MVTLDAPAGLGGSGGFAASVWIRRPVAGVWQPLGEPRGDEGGAAPFEYFLSWARDGWQDLHAWDGFLPNMVHLYTPAPGQPLFGLVRSILRDGAANSSRQVYLDSDGGRAVPPSAGWPLDCRAATSVDCC
jgi:hypothetical protein